MIVARIIGGLGNQMFQYAAARRVALVNGCLLGLDQGAMADYALRRFALDAFVLGADVLRDVNGDTFSRGRGLVGRIRRKLRGDRDLKEASFRFDPAILGVRPPVRFVGYWQSEKYFADVADRIRADFALAEPMTAVRTALAAEITATESISVHVRRGDYVTDPAAAAMHGTCSLDWYARAAEQVARGMTDPNFFVFSDDPAWVRENMVLPGRMCVVDVQPDGRDAEDMHLMAKCSAHVIANSSFSWWGAWLDARADAPVVAPARWFAGASHDTTDLLPDRWQRL